MNIPVTPKRPENVVINMARVQTTAATILKHVDKIQDGSFHDILDGEILNNVATIRFNGVDDFDRIFSLAVFENGTFQIMSSTTVGTIDALRAYHRALEFIEALELTNGRPGLT